MSLRYASRIVYQVSMRAAQGIKDQASAIKSLKDTAASSKQVRKLSSGFDPRSPLKQKGSEEEIKRSEESLRTVMYLSCWGPN